jgi:hypothetical protein
MEKCNMLHVPTGAGSYGLTTPSWGTTRPAGANGTSVTPVTGTGNFGSWAQLGSALTADAYGLFVNINSNNASTTSRNTIINIGVDESGGTSYEVQINRLIAGGASSYVIGGGLWYYFPLFIPSGSTVAAQARGTVTTAFNVGAVFFQRPNNPSMIRRGAFVETLGLASNVNTGTSVTAGTTAEGAWTLMGTTTRRCWWWQYGMQVSSADTTWNSIGLHMDIAVGTSTTKDIIVQDALISTNTAEYTNNYPLSSGVEYDVPAGTNVYVRLQNSGANDPYFVAIYGLGG